jgi:archaellum component FlaC
MKSSIEDMKSSIEGMKSSIEDMKSNIHRVTCLVEDQHNRNVAVLDGHRLLYDRQDRFEERIDNVEKTIGDFKKAGAD